MVHAARVEGWAQIWLGGVTQTGDDSVKAHVREREDGLRTGELSRDGATPTDGGWSNRDDNKSVRWRNCKE
ncbi:hypothetical protein Csa_012809 [Cucumis sativus]|uniref:Uncharacterized protein n=1 Tax=Cucumis sativus TaxID=3659 RepID=A0A0A0L277_CUCSA|nr:hypothetical protein Csa_012809 [Cucumis sativus]